MNKNISALTATLLMLMSAVLFGCAIKEDFGHGIVEGMPVTVSIKYNVDSREIVTRAEQESQYEYRVNNLYLFIFNSAGNRMDVENQDGNCLFEENKGLTVNNGISSSNGSLQFQTKTINNGKVVGIANVTTATTATAYNVTKEELDNIRTYSELQDYIVRMRENSIERGALFLMTGTAVNSQGTEDITITGNESGTAKLDCTVILKRTDAKVRVNVSTAQTNPDWQNFSFRPTGWQIMRVPAQTLILDNNKSGVDADGGTYFDTQERVFETINQEGSIYNGGSFVFYMPENKKKPKQEITGTGDKDEDYKLREKWNTSPITGSDKPGQTEENTDFMYANDNSTYMVLTGHLSYIDTKGYNVSADVKYYIHLGSDVTDPNDYDTRRNSEYTYNIKVGGIDNIIVEVTDKTDPRPGHEGDVVYSDKIVYELDSHYDRILFTLSEDIVGPTMSWGVNTPFSDGVHSIYADASLTENPIPENMKDYRWIKFAINKEYGVGNNQFVKYPGDNNYSDPYVEGTGTVSEYYRNSYPEARLRDIDQLLKYLVNNPDIFDSDGTITITAFVDENLYFNHPITGEPGENNRSLWKASVDKSDRQLHIIMNDPLYSPDGNSSVINSIYTFKQKAIRTIFNTLNDELTTAWGLESVMETDRLVTGKDKSVNIGSSLWEKWVVYVDEYYGKSLDNSNGRSNTLQWLVGKKWDDVISRAERYKLNSNYEYVPYACLLRNRDLNGDNIIQSNEIRWYLASINQLVDIYLGEYALDPDDRLYPTNPADRPGRNQVYWHYCSSSQESDGYPFVLWAEEGASTGSFGSSKDSNGERYAYRCVRNLGLSLSNPDEVPTDIVKYTNSNGTVTVDLSYMNGKSLRTNLETVPLPLHDELSSNNRPYKSFVIYNSNTTSQGRQPWSYYQTGNVCPSGYRIPNLRELLIMGTRLSDVLWNNDNGNYYMSQTAFSMDDVDPYNSDRDGFMYYPSTKKLILYNNFSYERGYVRCIKDTD